MIEMIQALFLIFIAELGDKTQIMAMSFATKYKIHQILVGVGLGVVLNHGLAVVVGGYLDKLIDINLIQILASALFIIFGYMSLKVEEDENEDSISKYGPIVTVALAFFLGEMGDKTQLTAMALATNAKFPLLILLGTTMGMILTSLMGILVGIYLGKKVPEKTLKVISGCVFVLLGCFKLMYILPSYSVKSMYIFSAIFVVIFLYMILVYRFIKLERIKTSKYKAMSERLNIFKKELKTVIYSSCNNKMNCSTCSGNKCLINEIYRLLSFNSEEINDSIYELNSKLGPNLENEKLMDALKMILEFNEINKWKNENTDIRKIRFALEEIIINDKIEGVENLKSYKAKVKDINIKAYNDINNLFENDK